MSKSWIVVWGLFRDRARSTATSIQLLTIRLQISSSHHHACPCLPFMGLEGIKTWAPFVKDGGGEFLVFWRKLKEKNSEVDFPDVWAVRDTLRATNNNYQNLFCSRFSLCLIWWCHFLFSPFLSYGNPFCPSSKCALSCLTGSKMAGKFSALLSVLALVVGTSCLFYVRLFYWPSSPSQYHLTTHSTLSFTTFCWSFVSGTGSAASCNDCIMNDGETGIDCGGSCATACGMCNFCRLTLLSGLHPNFSLSVVCKNSCVSWRRNQGLFMLSRIWFLFVHYLLRNGEWVDEGLVSQCMGSTQELLRGWTFVFSGRWSLFRQSCSCPHGYYSRFPSWSKSGHQLQWQDCALH